MSKARFGVFELDLATGELRKGGTRIRLQEQPFQVLKALIDQPGEAVSREELKQRLWPDDTFVDFEDGLSTAVKKIRRALGDSAANPRFVETLPKRGYRFIAPVEGGESSGPARGPWGWAGVGAAAVALLVWAGMKTTSPEARVPARDVLQPVPLTSLPGQERMPDFSPDGSQVAFAWSASENEDLDIYIKVVGEDEPIRITDSPDDDYGPAWSPDGRWIAFSRHGPQATTVEAILVPALGGAERKLYTHPSGFATFGTNYAWTRDSNWLIAPGMENRRERGLVLVPLRGGERRELTRPPPASDAATMDVRPAVSADGRQLAFSRCVGVGCDLFVVALPTPLGSVMEARRLTASSNVYNSVWSPDGQDIIYEEESASFAPGLWRVRADGSAAPRPLGLSGRTPAIAAGARRLAYARRLLRTDIWRLHLDGPGAPRGSPERLVASSRMDTQPHWSPDGRSIAFGSNRSGTTEVWLADADGSKLRKVTEVGGAQTGTPSFSPDGKRLVFNSRIAGNREVFVLDLASGVPRNVTNHPAHDVLPRWARDGLWIYLTSDRSGRNEIWKVPADGGRAVQLTKRGGSGGLESRDGKYFYYINGEDEPAPTLGWGQVWRVPVDGGEEEIVSHDGAHTHFFAVGAVGFYSTPPATPEGPWLIQYFDLASGESQTVVELPNPPFTGLALSPDGRALLYSRRESSETDLMLVEGFE